MADWLEYMPFIPLARGVPVIDKNTKWRGVTVVVKGRLVVKFDQVEGWVDADSTFVDLDDPQGFAYAFQYAYWHVEDDEFIDGERSRLMWAILDRTITDADRVGLAQALKELTNG